MSSTNINFMKNDSVFSASFQQTQSKHYQINQLPLNIFLTPSEYNKMIITNGKNRQKQTSHITQGYLSNLQFVNDNIFEQIQQNKALRKINNKNESKTDKKSVGQCTCCCCQQFCRQCAFQGQNCKKFQSTEMKKAISQIDQQIAIAKQRSKMSLTGSYKKGNQNVRSIKYSRRSNSAFSNKNYLMNRKSPTIKLSQNQKTLPVPDISHLLMKSLIQFQENKQKQALMKKDKINLEKAKEQFLKQMNQKIRTNNLMSSKSSVSLKKTKSTSKAEVSKSYWNKVKNQVLNSLKNDNYSATLKAELKKYKLNVYGNTQLPKRQVKLSDQQVKQLRQKHEKEAKQLIEKIRMQKKERTQKIKSNLKSLEKQCKQNMQRTSFKPFKPTEEMINSAFKNIIQPQNNQKETKLPYKKSQRNTIKKQTKKKL